MFVVLRNAGLAIAGRPGLAGTQAGAVGLRLAVDSSAGRADVIVSGIRVLSKSTGTCPSR